MTERNGIPNDNTPEWRRMCGVCRLRLNPVKSPEGEMSWYHSNDTDHEPAPVPEPTGEDAILVCDFCLKPHPTWDFPTGPFYESGNIKNKPAIMKSMGDWASCDICKELIENDEYQKLAERSYESQVTANPGLAEAHVKAPSLAFSMIMNIAEMHAKFKKARKGPAVSLTQAQWVTAKLSSMFGESDAPVPYHLDTSQPEDHV